MHQIVLLEVVAAGFAISAESATRNEIVKFLARDVAFAIVLNELEACVANGPQVEPCVVARGRCPGFKIGWSEGRREAFGAGVGGKKPA